MKNKKNNMVRVTLEEARKLKSQSNPAQILAQQAKNDIPESAEDKDH